MEDWKAKLEKCTERCDFQGLLNSTCALNEYIEEKTVPYGHRNNQLSGSTFKYLSAITNRSSLRLPALINLAWHKVLHIYGNGMHTVTITILNLFNQKQMLIPLLLDHSNCSGADTLKNVEAEMKDIITKDFILNIPQLSDTFADSIILWGDTDYPTKSNVPLVLSFEQNADAFNITTYYNRNIFDESLIGGIMDYFQTILKHFVNERCRNLSISSIDILPEKQKKRIENWNEATIGNFPENKRLHHLVEEAAEATPDKLAVICQEICVTYKELNERANQVGHFLHSKQAVKVEEYIALFLNKTELLLMTILGIWKSGAAYIPIDPTYPDERVKFILEDSNAKTIITNEMHKERLLRVFSDEKFKLNIMVVEKLFKEAEKESVENLNIFLESTQLAYITYTSGTTGAPKGVYKEHKGVVNSITDLSTRYEMRRNPEVVVLFSAYVFEPFIRQTLIALVNSQLLVIADDNEKLDQVKFIEFLNKHSVTYLNGTASVLQEYDLTKCKTLSKLILVGEELTKTRYDNLRQKYQGRLICEYGFTESALVSCMNSFEFSDQRNDRSIGRPLRNVKAYIVNSNLKPVPVRVIGELYIGGVGISRGYMNRDNLTKERFLVNPFQTEREKKAGINHLMYKTGDLARWMENGDIEYIGRNDFQIKLRGNRIEPAEIESVVLQYHCIKKCTITVKDSKRPEESTASSRHLVGYFVAAENIEEDQLIAYLEKKLPRYMIPVRMVQVDEIRTNINGKVDLKALPEVEFTNINKIQRPRNGMDIKLIAIWSDALGISENRIGVQDDFFRLGGHSITCIQLIARIRQQLNCEVTIDNVFALRSIEKLSDFISLRNEGEDLKNGVSLKVQVRDGNEEILANSLQQGLVYHYLKQGQNDDAYVMQSHYQYSDAINIFAYKKAWEMAQATYPSLRLNFKVSKEIYQVFKPVAAPLDWKYIDRCNKMNSRAEVDRVMKEDRGRRYNLETGNLFRIYLIKEGDFKYSLVFSYHHIIIDGWSIPILFAFVHNIYTLLVAENRTLSAISTNPPPIDSAYFLSQKYIEDHRNDHLEHWAAEIEQIDQRVNLSGLLKDEIKYKIKLNHYDQIEEPKHLTQEMNCDLKRLHNFGITYGVTFHSILQFAWHKVLNIYGSGRHTVVGTTVSGRNIPVDGIENCVGLFINTLPLVVDHMNQTGMSIVEAIVEIQQKVNAMNCKSNVELGKLGSGNGELKHSLFDSLFVLEPKMDLDESMGFTLVKQYEKLDYPLAVIAREENKILKFTLYYAGELFEDHVIADVLELLEYVLIQVASNPEKCVRNMELLLPKQLRLMDRWNETKKPFPDEKTLHEIFEEAAKSNPNKVALVYEDRKMRYEELNKKANQFANYLRSLVAINPDDKIALILEKNDLLILSILGVWKSGAAFVPIDPSYPEERIEYMLDDTESKVVIVNDRNVKFAQGIKTKNVVKIVNIEKAVTNLMTQSDALNLTAMTCSTNLCYVIYTSGTTGTPKGVMTEHRGVVNLHDSLSTIFGLKSSKAEVLLSFSNFVFDHFVEQMTDALLSGQTLVILNDEMRSDKERLYKYIKDNQVTYLSGTPSVLSMYEYGDLKSITRIDAVGEDFTEALFKKIRSTFTTGIVINGYGPTETSITTHKRIYKVGECRINKSIGHQIYNSTYYVLNEFGQRVPIGAVGELHLGGIGVGRGYLNREDLTQKSFVANPFSTEEDISEGRNLRMYKTGDLSRLLSNGELECLGRNDFQVKVRGLRIELSEIEAVILLYPGITHCVVVAQNHENSSSKFLVGYYTSNTNLNEKDIISFLQKKSPSFMIPNRLIQVDSIPVTINGKCDTKKLPKVKQFVKDRNTDDNWNEIETKLRFIWSELLNLSADEIGLEDDFFSLGGDSLAVTSMTFMINKAFGKVVGVPQVFLHKSIKSLGHLINKSGHQEKIPEIRSDIVPVSLAQERLLFIDEMENRTSAFNVPFVFKLKRKADEKILKESLRSVVKRHQSLRSLLIKFQNSYAQKLVNESEFELLWPLCILTKNVCSEEFQKEISFSENYIFKLDEELPLRITFLNNVHTLELFVSIVFHHTCFDGWSFAIFQKDWLSYYNWLQTDDKLKTVKLPELNFHYKEFAVLQKNLLSGAKLNSLRSYWLEKLSNVGQLNLPTDFKRPAKFSYSGYEIWNHMDLNTTKALKNLAKSMKTSLFSVLTSAFGLTLSAYTGQEDILIGSPISNRLRSEFENVIGLFINILPLKISVNQDLSVADFVQSVGDEVVTSHCNQDMPLEKLVNDLKIDKDLSRHPLVQVVLNFNPLGSSIAEQQVQATPFELMEEQSNKDTTAKYDLSVTVTENKNGLKLNFTFAKMLFNKNTVEGYLNSFVHILSLFSKPEIWERRISELDLVSKRSKSTMHTLSPAINGRTRVDEGTTLSEIFEKIANQSKTEIGLVYKDVRLTYEELNARSNQVARMLHQKFVNQKMSANSKSVVVIFMDKNDWMITSILGIWKSGSAYVPIDPSYPAERVKFILKDTGSTVVLTNEANASRVKQICEANTEIEIVVVEREIEALETSAISSNLHENNLCYIIYTSGSTGVPKGVKVSHKNVVTFRESLLQHYSRNQTILFLSNFVFDFSIEQIMLSIFNWGKLIVIDNELVIDEQFYKYVNKERITYLSGTPSVITALDLSQIQHLKAVTVAGEKFQKPHFDKIRKNFKGKLINAYGVTETTVYNSIQIFGTEDPYKNSLGKFFPNTRYFLLDKYQRPLPEGAVAELYLSGSCVSQGYLNLEKVNSTNFVANPFYSKERDDDAFRLMYRTGDLVRLNVSGDMEYLARNDNQVKIRGLRIELQEIEHAVLSYKEIKQCYVFCDDNSLVCIYVQNSDKSTEEELHSVLKETLPNHMIPCLLQYKGQLLPVTRNGKLDTKKLQDFYRMNCRLVKIVHSAPRNKLEDDLCKIFSSVLGIPAKDIGTDDDFFHCGGDSISSLLLAGKIRNQLGLACNVKNIFENRTIRRLCDCLNISDLKTNGFQSTTSVQVNGNHNYEEVSPSGAVPLLPIQKWFFAKNLRSLNHWNQTFTIKVPQLDISKLTESLQKLVNHHDAFRLRFKTTPDGFVQYYDNAVNFDVNLHQYDVSTLTAEEMEVKLSKLSTLNIVTGPLYAVAFLQNHNKRKYKVWWTIHHLIVDSVSWRIIKDNLQTLCEGGSLGVKGTSYKDFALTLQGQFLSEKPYWDTIVDRVRSYNSNFTTSQKSANSIWNCKFNLDENESQRLLCGVQKGGSENKIQDYLLTAVGYSLAKLTNSPTNYITVEGHGREEIGLNLELSDTVGWFTTMYPVEIHTYPNNGIQTAIDGVTQTLKSIPNKGIGYGILYGYTDPPMPYVSFNFLGSFSNINNNRTEWKFCDLSFGLHTDETEKTNSTVIDITGALVKGCLNFSIDFNLESHQSQQFIETLKETLKQIIDHLEIIEPPLPFADFETYYEIPSETKSEVTLFILPPGEGGAESYFNNLVPSLKQFNLVVFNNYYLEIQPLDISFEELAAMYIKYVKKLQIKGPYNFLGWSFGGVLALEMSRQLSNSGDCIHNLFLIDSYLNVKKAVKDLNFNEDVEVIDKINHKYTRSVSDFENMCSKAKNIVIFKATLLNEMYKTRDQYLLYEYYRKTSCNNLDTLIVPTFITAMELKGHTHNTWAKDSKQVRWISNVVTDKLIFYK